MRAQNRYSCERVESHIKRKDNYGENEKENKALILSWKEVRYMQTKHICVRENNVSKSKLNNRDYCD